MTISTTTIKNSYSGNSSTDAFSYTFKITADSEMQVIIRSSTGTETVKSLTTHYTVSGAGNASGGTVTFTSGNIPATGETVILRRNTTQTQGMDLIENDPLPANTLETAVDKNLAIAQELQEQLDRSFKVSRTNTIASPEFTTSATDRASKTLGFDSSGDLTTVADFLPAGGDSAQFTYSTTTTDSDPGSGIIRFNNTTLASATAAYVDDLEANGTDVSAWLLSFDDVTGNATNRGRIRVSKSNTLDTWHVWKITGASTDASGYVKLALTYIDGAGSLAADDKVFLSFTASGEDGAIPGYYYKFATSTTDSDPGGGYLRFNNGTYASATAIYIDDADANSATTSADVLTWDDSSSTIKGYIHIVDINDSSTYARFSVTGSSTDASGYNKLAVTHLVSNNTFSADDELSVHFTRVGDKGDTGSQGNLGNQGVAGLAMTWETTTTDADQGAGKISANNGTISSATVLYVDDVDDAGADISGFVQSWDDASNSVARGFVRIEKEGTASTFALFKVSGSVTDASGYSKVAVTHIVSSGTLSDGDGVGVHFTQSGADGSGDMSDLTDDTSPQLGGDLDVNGQDITSASNADVDINPHGTGNVVLKTDLVSVGGGSEIGHISSNGAYDLKLDTNSSTNSGSIVITDGANGDIDITTNGTGAIKFNDLAYIPQQAITSTSNAVAWDAQAKPNAYHITTENTTFSAPSNAVEGAFICLELNFNGSHTIGWNTVFEFAASTEPTETATDAKTDIHIFRYNGAVWQEVGRTMNLSES